MSALFEKTLLIVKPDAIERGLLLPLLGEICFHPIKARMFTPFREIWAMHYHEHIGKDFYTRLSAHMSSGPIFAMIVGGVDAVHMARQRVLALREKYGTVGPRNLLHASDSVESAEFEVNLWDRNL